MSPVTATRFVASILATTMLLLTGCGLENEPVPQQEQTPLEQQDQTLASDGTEVQCFHSDYNRQLYCVGLYRGGAPATSYWNYQTPGGWMSGWYYSGNQVNWYNCCKPRGGYYFTSMEVRFSTNPYSTLSDVKFMQCELAYYGGPRTECY